MFAFAAGTRPLVTNGVKEVRPTAARSVLVPIRLLEQ